MHGAPLTNLGQVLRILVYLIKESELFYQMTAIKTNRGQKDKARAAEEPSVLVLTPRGNNAPLNHLMVDLFS